LELELEFIDGDADAGQHYAEEVKVFVVVLIARGDPRLRRALPKKINFF